MDNDWGYPYDSGNLHLCISYHGIYTPQSVTRKSTRDVVLYPWFTQQCKPRIHKPRIVSFIPFEKKMLIFIVFGGLGPLTSINIINGQGSMNPEPALPIEVTFTLGITLRGMLPDLQSCLLDVPTFQGVVLSHGGTPSHHPAIERWDFPEINHPLLAWATQNNELEAPLSSSTVVHPMNFPRLLLHCHHRH